MKRLILIATIIALTGATQAPIKVMSPEWIKSWINKNINTNDWYFVTYTKTCLYFIRNDRFDYSNYPNVTYWDRSECFMGATPPSAVSFINANCKTLSTSTRSLTAYLKNNMTGGSETMTGNEYLKPTIPGSVGEDIVKTFCGFAETELATEAANAAADAAASTGQQQRTTE